MRHYIKRIGPAHAFGYGCFVGIIIALLPAVLVGLGLSLLPAAQAWARSQLGFLGMGLSLGPTIPEYVPVGAAVLTFVITGLLYGLLGWILAIGYNLVARLTGGLALDVEAFTPGGLPAALPPASPGLAPTGVNKDPTMQLPRPGPVSPAVTPISPMGSPASGSPASVAQAWLISAADSSQYWPLRGAVIRIGSDPANDIVLSNDPDIAPQHAEVRSESSGYVLYDLGSAGGTFVNDRRISGRNLLKNDFRVRLGKTELLVRLLK